MGEENILKRWFKKWFFSKRWKCYAIACNSKWSQSHCWNLLVLPQIVKSAIFSASHLSSSFCFFIYHILKQLKSSAAWLMIIQWSFGARKWGAGEGTDSHSLLLHKLWMASWCQRSNKSSEKFPFSKKRASNCDVVIAQLCTLPWYWKASRNETMFVCDDVYLLTKPFTISFIGFSLWFNSKFYKQ